MRAALLLIALLPVLAACGGASEASQSLGLPTSPSEPPLATEARAFVQPSASTAPSAQPTAATMGPSPAPLKVKVTALTKSVRRGSNASVSVQTTPGAACGIIVTYASGPSEAAGLNDKTAGKTGYATWKWKVGPGTTKGTWPIDVACEHGDRSGHVQTKFTVK